MMKGSNSGQMGPPSGGQYGGQSSGAQSGYGAGFGGMNSPWNPFTMIANYMGMPSSMLAELGISLPNSLRGTDTGAGTGAGTGTKGSGRASQAMSVPQMPEYVNYQNTQNYTPQANVGPSDAITRFMSGYASGGAVDEKKLEGDIEAALRIARLIGELTKKL